VTPCAKLCRPRIRFAGVVAPADSETAAVVAPAGYYCRTGSGACIPWGHLLGPGCCSSTGVSETNLLCSQYLSFYSIFRKKDLHLH